MRIWRALRFAFTAFRFHWRHGVKSTLSLPGAVQAPLAVEAPVEEANGRFRIEVGEKVAYAGGNGGDARRVIERLRRDGARWIAYRDDSMWDWGPR